PISRVREPAAGRRGAARRHRRRRRGRRRAHGHGPVRGGAGGRPGGPAARDAAGDGVPALDRSARRPAGRAAGDRHARGPDPPVRAGAAASAAGRARGRFRGGAAHRTGAGRPGAGGRGAGRAEGRAAGGPGPVRAGRARGHRRGAVRLTGRRDGAPRPAQTGGPTARVRDARRRLDELTRDQVPRPPAPLRFRAPLTRTGHGGDRTATAVAVRDVVVPGRLHVDHLDLAEAGRLLVAGPNGAGKSTLLAVLAGRLRPARGTVWHRDGLRVGLLPQDARFRRPQLPAGRSTPPGSAPAYPWSSWGRWRRATSTARWGS